MNLLHRFILQISKKGLLGGIKHSLYKFLELDKQKEEIDTLYYFLNRFNKMQELPPTDDSNLRILQRCDVMLLGIFDKLCRKHNLTYWIEYGTLLGAVRHGGFIPWDDDTDLAMTREEYNKTYDLLHEELAKYGIDLFYKNNEHLSWLGLGYKHEETGIWADIAPMDLFMSEGNLEETEAVLFPPLGSYKEYYRYNSQKISQDEMWEYKKKNIFSLQKGTNRFRFHGQEFRQSALRVFHEEDLLPVKRIKFEDVELNAPANPDAYLTYVYSKNYMGFPRKGVEHHGGDRGLLKNWATFSNTDMTAVYNHLKSVYESL